MKVRDFDILAWVWGQRKMSQVLGSFGLLDFTMLRLVLAWRVLVDGREWSAVFIFHIYLLRQIVQKTAPANHPPFLKGVFFIPSLYSALFNGQSLNPASRFADIKTSLQVLQSMCLHCQIFSVSIGFI
jgi:hypothetical protein